MGIIRGIIFVSALGIAAYYGDKLDVNDRIINPVAYRNVLADKESYPRPFKLRKRYVINEKGMLETYIGEGNRWHKVGKDLTVNSELERIARKTKEARKELEKKIIEETNNFVNWLEEELSR